MQPTGAQPELQEAISSTSSAFGDLIREIHKVIVGQEHLLKSLVIGLLADGHILLEGVPGLAKTLSIQTLAQAIQVQFNRIQFTPDLLPADLIGTRIYNPKSNDFEVKSGPIFTNLLLADEINRAPAKVQSALLEAMQERQVTIGHETFPLSEPFLVMATQNPLEHEGTYPLPEAQLDRFMLKVRVTYPTFEEELEIVNHLGTRHVAQIVPVLEPQVILDARSVIEKLYLDDKIKRYIVNLIFATRYPTQHNLSLDKHILYGASPRASIYLALCAKVWAFLEKRTFVIPEDVKAVGMDILRHRIAITYEAEAEEITPEDIIRQVFETVKVP